jgi:hypothetical protein
MIGTLDIALDAGRGPPAWRVTTAGRADAAGWLVGRRAEEAALLIPRVFNLCASAHAEAACGALGLSACDAEGGGLSRQERLRDHAVAVLCDWPAMLGGIPDRDALKGLAGGSADAMGALRSRLLGIEIDLADGTVRTLDRWLSGGASATARLLARLRVTLDPAWGRAELPTPELADVVAALAAGAPTVPRETTAADRWRATPMLAALVAREGMSLFVRMLARLFDLLACVDAGRASPEDRLRSPEAGIGLARAARGLLTHRARVVGGIVTDYRILSPSAWNLAESGLLGRMLAALPMGPQTPMLARLAVSCVNPCVPVRLRFGAMEEARHA